MRLAAEAAADMVAGRKVGTARLVVSLRDFIRRALDLEPISHGLVIPDQGPVAVVLAAPEWAGQASMRTPTTLTTSTGVEPGERFPRRTRGLWLW